MTFLKMELIFASIQASLRYPATSERWTEDNKWPKKDSSTVLGE